MLVARKIGVQDGIAYIVTQIIGALLASAVLLGILSGVIGDAAAGIAEYSRSIHGLGANDVPSFLSVRSALGIEVVLTALFLYVIFNATSSAARPGTAGLAIGGYLFVAHIIGVPLGDSSLNPARSIGSAILQGDSARQRLGFYCGTHPRWPHRLCYVQNYFEDGRCVTFEVVNTGLAGSAFSAANRLTVSDKKRPPRTVSRAPPISLAEGQSDLSRKRIVTSTSSMTVPSCSSGS